jgi:hypothetical protein
MPKPEMELNLKFCSGHLKNLQIRCQIFIGLASFKGLKPFCVFKVIIRLNQTKEPLNRHCRFLAAPNNNGQTPASTRIINPAIYI